MTKNNEQIIIDDLKEMIYKLQIECAEKTDNILALGEKLHSKEQECEELKKDLDFQKSMYECARADEEDKFEEIIELKQTLEEIREIAENTISSADEICCHECDGGAINAEKILQKINEVIDEHN